MIPEERKAWLQGEQDKWLTIDEAALVLRTSVPTILAAIHRGAIDLFAEGKVWRIHVESLVKAQKPLAQWTSHKGDDHADTRIRKFPAR